MYYKIEKTAELIYKNIMGCISKSEQQKLDAWREEDEENGKLLAKVSDPVFLEKEYVRRKSVQTEKALINMKRRIQSVESLSCQRKRKVKLLFYLNLTASLLLLAGCIVTMYYYNQTDHKEVATITTQHQIKHGKVQAVLTFDNGVSIEFGEDSTKNMKAFKRALIADCQSHETQDSEQSTPISRLLNLSTPRGGEFKFALDDGTEVWLNAESQLAYPEKFKGDERRVILYGEAYFKVAKNAKKPFIVESGGQEIHVTGTEFNIRNYAEDPYIYTTLVSGSIILKTADSDNTMNLTLMSGHQAAYDKTNHHIDVQTVDTDIATCWKNGKFVFDDQTLEQIICTLSRWYDFTYEFKDSEIKNTLFMGSVPRYGNFNDVIRILEASGGLYFKVEGKKVQIFRN